MVIIRNSISHQNALYTEHFFQSADFSFNLYSRFSNVSMKPNNYTLRGLRKGTSFDNCIIKKDIS